MRWYASQPASGLTPSSQRPPCWLEVGRVGFIKIKHAETSEFDVLIGRQFGSNRDPLGLSDMTTVGIGLIVIGVAQVCGGLILWPRHRRQNTKTGQRFGCGDTMSRSRGWFKISAQLGKVLLGNQGQRASLNQRVTGSIPVAFPKLTPPSPLARGGLRFPVSARRYRLQAFAGLSLVAKIPFQTRRATAG